MMARLQWVGWALLTLVVGCGGEEAAVTAEQVQQLREQSVAYAGRSAASLMADPAALAVAGSLYAAHCQSCHGGGAQEPRRGAPALATAVFNYGSDEAAIRQTITAGRHSVMPAFGAELGEVEIGAMVAYVRGLHGGEGLKDYGETAQALYGKHCVTCHGESASGNPALGIPNLSDAYWLNGESMMNVRMVITRGVDAECPAQAAALSSAEIELLVAHVLALRTH